MAYQGSGFYQTLRKPLKEGLGTETSKGNFYQSNVNRTKKYFFLIALVIILLSINYSTPDQRNNLTSNNSGLALLDYLGVSKSFLVKQKGSPDDISTSSKGELVYKYYNTSEPITVTKFYFHPRKDKVIHVMSTSVMPNLVTARAFLLMSSKLNEEKGFKLISEKKDEHLLIKNKTGIQIRIVKKQNQFLTALEFSYL